MNALLPKWAALLMVLAGAGAVSRPALGGALELASPFTDHAVLQRDANVPVWGWTGPGAAVCVTFAGREVKATADAQGRWMAHLAPLAASSEGRPLRVTSGEAAIELQDVVVGEVWLASGQSNMEMPLAPAPNYPGVTDWEKEVAAADYPRRRSRRGRSGGEEEGCGAALCSWKREPPGGEPVASNSQHQNPRQVIG